METFIAVGCWQDNYDCSKPYLKKIIAENLNEAEIIFLERFYNIEDCDKDKREITLEDLKEKVPDDFCYLIKNIKDL